ncbi:MAG TPA: VIT family protein [Ilumatobacter sp.]|nr:VIT family protein [Ilumatobacter sp.]
MNGKLSRRSRYHRREPHDGTIAARLNWLRAGVLGANDGIISTAGLVIGVAAATSGTAEIATAGVAGLVAGSVSMALGEYVSVSTQRDSERALIAQERSELAEMPDAEHEELVGILRGQGMTEQTAEAAATELAARDPLAAHLRLELGLDATDLALPWAAAGSSAGSFALGALIPLLAVLLPPDSARIPVTFVAVLVALTLTGVLSARLGGSQVRSAVLRLVAGGTLAMLVTFGIGQLLNVTV